jgi:hypothetical protein
LSSDLQAKLDDVWQACLDLPISEAAFDSLDPHERRQAHDTGVRIQDRILITLSQLVTGMASDGIELVSVDGVPQVLSPAPSDGSTAAADSSPPENATDATATAEQG